MKRTLSMALTALATTAAATLAPPALAKSQVGYITIKGSVADRTAPGAMLFGMAPKKPTLRTLVAGLEAAAADPTLDGLVIRLKEPALTPAQVDELGAAMQKVRDAGKKITVFTEIYGTNELRFAAHADEALIQAGGAVSLPGVYMEEMYLAGTLEWLGLKFDRVMIGDYKGAMETLAQDSPTPAWEKNITQLLDGMYDTITSDIKSGRNMTDAQLEGAMENCFFALPDVAIKYGLLDGEVDRLKLDDHLEKSYGEFAWVTRIGPLGDKARKDYANMGFFEAFSTMMEMLSGQAAMNTPTRATIAVLHIKGPIMDGESTSAGFMSSETVGSLTIREALKEIEDNDLIKGVVVRIESPGGSAIASESIWQGLRRIAKDKPVYASIGGMAASGGYYIAVGTDKIYINPSSIVGSIGVVGGKLTMGGLHEKIHANVIPRSRGPMAGMMSTARPWSDTERNKIATLMTQWYDQFVQRVKTTRTEMDISKTAEGRLFVGDKAVELKMADAIGGIDKAIDDMAMQLSLYEGGYDVLDYPAPKSFEEMLEEAFPFAGVSAESSATFMLLREVMGEEAFAQVRDALTAMLQARTEPVLLTSPRVLIFR